MKLFNFTLLLILSFSQIYGSSFLEAYRCENLASTSCTLKDIFFDDGDSGRFLPKSKIPYNVIKASFVSSKIPILTSDICDNFPNLEVFEVNAVSLKVVDAEAVHGCMRLREIHLRDNLLTTLYKDTFQNNQGLNKIVLNNNKLTTIPHDLFKGLYQLKWIDLCSNSLSRLPAVTFTGLTAMENLEVRNNPLLSLEVEEMRKKMPRLKYLLCRDLDLTCDRMTQVEKFLTANGLDYNIRSDYSTYHSKSAQSVLRLRPYTVSMVKSFECLSNEQHEREVLLREYALKRTSVDESVTYEMELRKSVDAFKEDFGQKMEELVKETRDTQSMYFIKISEAQNFMLKLIKDKIESQDSKFESLNSQIKNFNPNNINDYELE